MHAGSEFAGLRCSAGRDPALHKYLPYSGGMGGFSDIGGFCDIGGFSASGDLAPAPHVSEMCFTLATSIRD